MSEASRRRFSVRRSPIHGRGVYATTDLPAGTPLLEYQGEVISWDVANERYFGRPDGEESTTYFFDLGDGAVIDGDSNGNSARFINHGCDPNCEAVVKGRRVFIHAARAIRTGEELLLDYSLEVDEPDDPDLRELYACHCAAENCRRTMLAA